MPHFKFLGQVGEYLVAHNGYGVPGRDLSQADVDALDPAARETLEQHVANSKNPIYERHDEDLPAPEAPAADAAPAAIGLTDVPSNVALQVPPESVAGAESAPIPDASAPAVAPDPNQPLDAPAEGAN